jgi:phage FluMu protein gp41
VVVAFADAYINWNAQTVSSDMQTLAAESIGQAHSAMEMAASETARDYELQRGGIANSGQIEAVGPLSGSRNEWVVVTRERTTATASNSYQGLAPAWHVILATAVELSSGRWVVSQWQPES